MDPNFQLFECDDDSTNDDPNKELKMMSDATDEQLSHFRSNIFPVIQFFKQEELLHVVRYTYAIYRYTQDENTVSHTCIYSFG
jgi:hypothetical protein